jgi:hypothetical protein
MKKKKEMHIVQSGNAPRLERSATKGYIQGTERALVNEIDIEIQQIRNDLKLIKSEEITRLMHEASFNNYEKKNGITLQELLTRMFGLATAKKEMEKKKVKI